MSRYQHYKIRCREALSLVWWFLRTRYRTLCGGSKPPEETKWNMKGALRLDRNFLSVNGNILVFRQTPRR